MTHEPTGCADCQHATARFNSGIGATTCDLGAGIVAYGREMPTTRPELCPLDISDEERARLDHEWLEDHAGDHSYDECVALWAGAVISEHHTRAEVYAELEEMGVTGALVVRPSDYTPEALEEWLGTTGVDMEVRR